MASLPNVSTDYRLNLLPRSVSPTLKDREQIQSAFFEILGSIIEQMELATSKGFQSCLEKIALTLPKNKETDKMIGLATQFNQILVENRQEAPPEHEFESWVQGVAVNGKIFLDSQIVTDIKPVVVPASLHEYLSVSPEDLSCFDYALLQTQEARALFRDYQNEEVPSLLTDWGYTATQTPAPGDLVLYLNQGSPMHLGKYLGNGMVESKWGNQIPVAYVHKTEDVPEIYGEKIVYFRPPAHIPTTKELLQHE